MFFLWAQWSKILQLSLSMKSVVLFCPATRLDFLSVCSWNALPYIHVFFPQAATSLNSNECFLLQSGSSIFTWHGNQSTFEQQQLAAKVADFLKVCSLWNILLFKFGIFILINKAEPILGNFKPKHL